MATRRRPRLWWRRLGASLLCHLILAGGVLSGCAGLTAGSGRASGSAGDDRVRREEVEAAYRELETSHRKLTDDHRKLADENDKLLKENQRLDRERQALQENLKKVTGVSEEELARLRLMLLERDTQIKVLNQKLDASILEVVRTLAKLRSLESKPEAASNLAEAEIAVKMLEGSGAGREKDPDVAHAENLLKMGAEEFRKDNFGGALYLSTQAKSLIKGGQARSLGNDKMPKVDGEVSFALPLPLRIVARSQAREGPGTSFKVAFPLSDGATVTGQSYKGLWVRIRGEDGRSGWVLYNLVGQR
jgi:hypothetical protein